jgi:hypothetical protein
VGGVPGRAPRPRHRPGRDHAGAGGVVDKRVSSGSKGSR